MVFWPSIKTFCKVICIGFTKEVSQAILTALSYILQEISVSANVVDIVSVAAHELWLPGFGEAIIVFIRHLGVVEE